MPDGPQLRRRQLNAVQFDLAEPGERQREHDVIGMDLAGARAAGESTGVPAVTAPAQGHQPLAEADGAARQPADETGDELIIAAPDMPLLVGAGELRLAPWLQAARRAVIQAEQVDQVQR